MQNGGFEKSRQDSRMLSYKATLTQGTNMRQKALKRDIGTSKIEGNGRDFHGQRQLSRKGQNQSW